MRARQRHFVKEPSKSRVNAAALNSLDGFVVPLCETPLFPLGQQLHAHTSAQRRVRPASKQTQQTHKTHRFFVAGLKTIEITSEQPQCDQLAVADHRVIVYAVDHGTDLVNPV